MQIGEEINTEVIEIEANFSPHDVKQYLEDRKGIFMLQIPGQRREVELFAW